MSSILEKLSDMVSLIIQNKNMVFIPFRTNWTMSQQSSKVRVLYDHCKSIFTPSGTPVPSSQALHELNSILDTVQPVDIGLEEETTDDNRGHGSSNQLNGEEARWGQPIIYIGVHECDSFKMCLFCFPTNSVIPLHDHPEMTVFSKVLYGSLHVKSYDWVEPARILESKEPGHPLVRLAKLAVDQILTAPCETSILYPKHGGNKHCFTAIAPSAVLDILSPPYSEDAGRKCTYYQDYPYSAFSAGSGPEISDSKEEEYAWLAEIETPADVYMCPGVYAGPTIQI